jgi:hypothetical protein
VTRPDSRSSKRRQRSAGEIQPIGVVAVVVVLGVVALILLPVFTIFDLPFFQVQASIQPAASVAGGTVHVTATTDLPDGAVVVCYLADAESQIGDSKAATVAGGAFAIDLPLQRSTGSVEADCRFGTAWARQPKSVIDTFGQKGERMAGPQVFREGLTTPKELFASVTVGPIGGDGSPPAGSLAASPGAS